ncbi:MAG: hypothetical protein KDD62_14165, partial [Bdellovibrionales bacterium]|nr:hypothetical protein [Bdellovibrionales bacterium]
DFLDLTPTVLSKGFRINTTFGIDYNLQASVTSAVVEILKKQIIADLQSGGYGSDHVSVKVEFARAAESSLDLAIITDFIGSCAGDYQVLHRLVQKICVDACNANGWVIPFNQLTVHMAKDH